MSTPAFTDSFGNEYYSARVACDDVSCMNVGVEIELLLMTDGTAFCGGCSQLLAPLAAGVSVSPPVHVFPELDSLPSLELPQLPDPGPVEAPEPEPEPVDPPIIVPSLPPTSSDAESVPLLEDTLIEP